MKKTACSLALCVLAALLSPAAAASDYAKYVNPFVGTDGHGHTFPAAVHPFGMVQAGPDTRLVGWDGCSGYHYSDSLILGFTHTHLSGTGCLDWGDILLMPTRGGAVESRFSHERETASPGFYSVWLEDTEVDVRIAAGRRVAMHEYSYGGGDREVWLDLHHRDRLLDAELEIVGENAVQGRRRSRSWAKDQDVYFYAEFSSPIQSSDFADPISVRLHFGGGAAPLKVKLALSSVSCANAKANLLSEIKEGDWNLDALAHRTRAAWNTWLSRIAVKGGTEQQMRTFYTALYHCAIHPSLYSDCNGEYRGMDRKVHKAEGFERYTVLSIWDVFRAAFPLYNMVARDYMPDFLESMMSVYRECGRLPKWELAGNETNTMIGFNAVSVIADAWAKGTLPRERLEEFYEAMKGTAESFGSGYDLFCQYGYDPAGDDDQSVSKTLEYAYDSWCVALIASELGRMDDCRKYMERAQYWKNVFDPGSGFMRPREHGCWAPEFSPEKGSSHFTEANSWQYSFFVPQDIQGHIDIFGGRDRYIEKLDSLFSTPLGANVSLTQDVSGMTGQYAHGNEPSHHVAYLYDFVGQPWKTQRLVRDISSRFYTPEPDGLCGNEDCGQMSAWYVMSALGLYSVTPGTRIMATGSPLFRKAKVNTGSSHFSIRCDRPDKTYVGSLEFNGKPYDSATIDFMSLLGGGELSFRMSDGPSEFGSRNAEVSSIDGEYEYNARFEEGFGEAQEEAAASSLKVTLNTPFYPSYSAGGPQGLVDGRRGRPNWRAGGWQGYRGCAFDATVDLDGMKTVSGVWAEYLQDMDNYIWMPGEMKVFVSTDGVDFTQAGSRVSDVAVDAEGTVIETWKIDFAPVDAAFVRIVASQFGEIPSWHRGYGDKGFIFVDEIGVTSL